MVCPRCDGQGWIDKIVVVGFAHPLFVCDECDAMWSSREAVGVAPWADFETEMKSAGIEQARKVATVLERNVT